MHCKTYATEPRKTSPPKPPSPMSDGLRIAGRDLTPHCIRSWQSGWPCLRGRSQAEGRDFPGFSGSSGWLHAGVPRSFQAGSVRAGQPRQEGRQREGNGARCLP